MIANVLVSVVIVAVWLAMWPLAVWQGQLRENPHEVTA